MKFKMIDRTSSYVTIEILTKDIFQTQDYEIYLNNVCIKKSNRIIQTIYNLTPDTEYTVFLKSNESVSDPMTFSTKEEFVTLNVRLFGAKGDGIQDDTIFIQAAINSCPPGSRVYIPKGCYNISTLFLKSDLTIELGKDAILSATLDKDKYPILPGLVESLDEQDECNIGTWEGNPLDMYAGIITGINISNVTICGQGTMEGNASYSTWWGDWRLAGRPYRPRMIYLNNCKNITLQGITVQNSPSWTIHPYFCENIKCIDLTILNPKDAPNTDGLNPESCKNVEIAGVYFSVGDDCIAIKSGKIYMGKKHKKPSEDIIIRQCYMRDGHGSVTIGSEVGAGVKNIQVKNCRFQNTDRGLRIKTRRGRGKDSIINDIIFENIIMDHVLTPFAINMFYFCDPDGHSEYVQTKESLPVDERTPSIGQLTFNNIKCTNAHIAGMFFDGLPEKKIEKIVMDNIEIEFASNPVMGFPVLKDNLEEMSNMGMYANNIGTLMLSNINIIGAIGKDLNTYNIDNLISGLEDPL